MVLSAHTPSWPIRSDRKVKSKATAQAVSRREGQHEQTEEHTHKQVDVQTQRRDLMNQNGAVCTHAQLAHTQRQKGQIESYSTGSEQARRAARTDRRTHTQTSRCTNAKARPDEPEWCCLHTRPAGPYAATERPHRKLQHRQ